MTKVKLRSRVRNVEKETETEDAADSYAKKKKAAAMRKYRARIKSEKPEQYNLVRVLEQDRLKRYRRNLKTDKRKHQNELARLRMQKYRKKLKEKTAIQPVGSQISGHHTRSAQRKQNKKREYWRSKKREQRAGLSAQKRRRIREKDAAQKRMSRAASNAKAPKPPQTSEAACQNEFPSRVALRKAISRGKKTLPKSSGKFADVVVGIINTCDSAKKKALKKKGIYANNRKVISCIKLTCKALNNAGKRNFVGKMSAFLDKKHGLKTKISKHLGFGKKYLARHSQKNLGKRKRHSNALSETTERSVHEFFEHPNVATELPSKKRPGKDITKPKFVLQSTLQRTHEQFCQENPNVSVSRSKFAALRPCNVLVQSKAKLHQCLCEYCTNIDLKIKAINKAVSENKLPCKLIDRYHVADLTLCSKGEHKYADLLCINRMCEKCGNQVFDNFMKPLTDCLGSSNVDVTWQKWGKASDATDTTKSRVTLLRITGTLNDLLKEMKCELTPFTAHLFNARWQQSSFYSISTNPPENAAVIVMDFAENYACVMQSEVQSAHWHTLQVTLHPMVAFYKCNLCSHPSPVREAMHMVSDDMIHDAHAVQHFLSLAVGHLSETRKLSLKRLIKFSDGCSSQYKSKLPLTDLSFNGVDFGMDVVEHHYFGSRHGKNPCDGEGGIVKHAASKAVKSGTAVIDSAEALFQFCCKSLSKSAGNDDNCNHSRRVFFLVKNGDVNRQRKERSDVTTVPGTRQIHAAIGIQPYHIKKRDLSCFCNGCSSGEKCTNSVISDVPWSEVILQKKNHREPPVTMDLAETEVVVETGDVHDTGFLRDLFRDVLPPEGSCDSPHQKEISIIAENYYAIYYDNEFYIGRMVKEDGEFFQFKFLHRLRHGNRKMYDWPRRSDYETVHGKYIFCGPLNLSGTGPFQVNNLEEIEGLYDQIKSRSQKED